LTEHDAPGATEAQVLLPTTNCVLSLVTLLTVSGEPPVLDTVTDCGAELVPMASAAKFRFGAGMETCAGDAAVPLRGMEELPAPVAIVNAPE
jgi:hypothetical protein